MVNKYQIAQLGQGNRLHLLQPFLKLNVSRSLASDALIPEK